MEEGKTNILKIAFTLIDPRKYSREFSFCVFVDPTDTYVVNNCEPPIPGDRLSELLQELNRSNNFAAFVHAMRREFKKVLQA